MRSALLKGASDVEEDRQRLWLQHLCGADVQLWLPEPECTADDWLPVRRMVPVRRGV